MGLREQLQGKRVYFDANIFIYLMEGFPALADSLNVIRESISHGEMRVCTSELTLCEVLVPAFRSNNTAVLSLYRQFIEDSGAFELIETSRNVYVRASLLRAQLGLKTPDAIHMASAMEADCLVFLTHDKSMRVPNGMTLLHL